MEDYLVGEGPPEAVQPEHSEERQTRAASRSMKLSSYLTRAVRAYATTAANSSLSPLHSIYVSRSTDVYFNLSLEDWFVIIVLFAAIAETKREH